MDKGYLRQYWNPITPERGQGSPSTCTSGNFRKDIQDVQRSYFRIHESGDFYNKEYTQKWIDIAKHFENNENIVFLAYTKSLAYFIQCGYGKDFPNNFIVRSSIWDDTKPESVRDTALYNFPIYTAFDGDTLVKEIESGNYSKCDCKDCAECGKCYSKTEQKIACAIH